MTVLEDAADHLEDNGLGTVGQDIFLSVLPQSPDACTALFEYAGSSPRETMGAMLARPRLQLVRRGARDDYPGARDGALDALAVLAAVVDATWASGRVLRIAPVAWINDMGRDEKDRPLVSVNFEVVADA